MSLQPPSSLAVRWGFFMLMFSLEHVIIKIINETKTKKIAASAVDRIC